MPIIPHSATQIHQADREREALAALAAHRAGSDLPSVVAAENAAHNDRLRALDARQRAAAAEHQAMLDGLRAYRDRRSKTSGSEIPGAFSSADHATRRPRRFRTARMVPLAAVCAAPAPEPEPLPLAPEHFRTALDLTAALFREGIPRAALALDVWKAHTRQTGGKGEFLPGDVLTALLMAAGLSRRTAQRAKAEGAGRLWDVYRNPRDRRRSVWHLRSYVAIQRALGLPDLGRWAILPAVAYCSLAEYVNHASAAWIAAHPVSPRQVQAEALGCSMTTVRARQRAAGLRQTARIDEFRKPQTLAEIDELADRLAGADGERIPHWRGPGGSYRRQTSNWYHSGPARILGRGRSRRIAALAYFDPSRRRGAGQRDASQEQQPRRFEHGHEAKEWQIRHPARGAYTYTGRLVPSGATIWRYSYSVEATCDVQALEGG